MNKAQFIRKIICPNHEERTPSCALYSDGSGYCFSCNTYFKQLGDKVEQPDPKPVEDIGPKIKYIKSLPKMAHRGLEFPYDSLGYYIVWPNEDYYKCRKWLPQDTGNKYENPSGVTQPWLSYVSSGPLALFIEGEINLLSVHSLAYQNLSLFCPGSAGQFKLNKCGILLPHFYQYTTVVIVADKDTAGAQAVIKLKKELLTYVPDIQIKLLKHDFNETLTNNGKEALKKEIEDLGLFEGVQND